MNSSKPGMLAVVTLLGVSLSFVLLADPAGAKTARQILKATGVQGGLVVHVGCGDGKLTAKLRANDRYLVHGLDTDGANVERARQRMRSRGTYGPVSVARLAGDRLPYAEGIVNLVVAEELGGVPMSEVFRVLAPDGVAYVREGRKWQTMEKPRPEEIDEWTHFLHGPDNNAVAQDALVGPPRHLRWQGLPKFARAHEQLASLSACVTAGGRMFYVIDETPRVDVRLPSRWSLVARDAFSGVKLWKREIPTWANQLRRFRSGPPDLAFRVVADAERVFVTLGIEAPVSVLDAATGRTVRTIRGTQRTKQIVHAGDALALLVDEEMARMAEIDAARRRGEYIQHHCRVLRADANTGKILWETAIDELVFPCMAVAGGRVFCQTPGRLQCLDFGTGRELWTAELPMALPIPKGKLNSGESQWEAPTVVVSGELVLVGDFKTLSAFSVADGELMWTGSTASGYNSPADVFVIGDLVWTKGKGSARTAFDRLTGEQKLLFPTDKPYMHPRCYRNKATERFMLLGDPGVQFLDVESGETRVHHWIRGTCQYGIMPANGLLYVTPDSCACNMKTKLNGLFALAAQREPPDEGAPAPRLERGPAYGQVAAGTAKAQDWPTYRHDARRSGMTATVVAPRLAPAWRERLGGRLTSVVAAEGQVFVASIDTHTVYALDDADGSTTWQYTAGGRIDSPPTVHKGLALFGCADGWIYALRTRDGQLVWRFRAAPEDRRVFVNGQLESVWPVHGSVLVRDGMLMAAAGRSSYLDGGIHMYRLNPATGEMISETVTFSPEPETGKQPADPNTKDVRGVKPDILLADGEDVYMRHVKVDFETGDETGTGLHLFTPLGFLDDTWWHRGYWVLSDGFVSHWSGWWRTGNLVPSGRIVSYDDSSVFGYGRDQYVSGNTGQWRGGEGYQLYSFDRAAQPSEPTPPRRNAGRTSELEYRWAQRVPMFVRAMVVADGTMFIAGPPDIIQPVGTQGEEALLLENPEDAHDAWVGGRGALMWAVSCEDGSKLAEYKLGSLPVFDGMIAANGRLYIALTSGEVLCLAGGP